MKICCARCGEASERRYLWTWAFRRLRVTGVTIASTHLENRAKPKIRRQQMEELLNEERDRANPVIVASDTGTTGSDSTPTSVENMLYKRYGSMEGRPAGYSLKTKGGPLTRLPWRSTATSTRSAILMKGMPEFMPNSGTNYRIERKRRANTPGEPLATLFKSDLLRAFIVNCQP